MAELRIALSGPYTFTHLERLIDQLGPLLTLDEPTRVKFDLSRLATIGPTALALIVAGLKRAVALNLLEHGSSLREPKAPPIRNYVLRMNLLRALGSGAIDASEDFERREALGFRAVEHFEGESDYPGVASGLTDALVEKCDTDDVARAAIRICLDEVCENVINHADTALGGFAAAQGWTRASAFELGIVDLGIGIRASLVKNPEYADIPSDSDAIARALQYRVTSTPERNYGMGLAVTKSLLAANGGEVFVRSGFGLVRSGISSTRVETSAMMPGIRARTDRPLDIAAVYELLARTA
jgi:hypothetical protein